MHGSAHDLSISSAKKSDQLEGLLWVRRTAGNRQTVPPQSAGSAAGATWDAGQAELVIDCAGRSRGTRFQERPATGDHAKIGLPTTKESRITSAPGVLCVPQSVGGNSGW